MQSPGPIRPRLYPDDIDAVIVSEAYYRFPGTTFIVCALTLANGFMVVGESRPISDRLFDESLGKTIAREKAREKIWTLEGYAMRERIAARHAVEDDCAG